MKSVGKATTGISFQEADNSHKVKHKAPTTIATNFSFVLPTGYDSAGQFIKADGSGSLSFGTVLSIAPYVNIFNYY